MLTDFVKTLSPQVVTDEAAPSELGVETEVVSTASQPAEATVETTDISEKISEQRTTAAIKATGITDGSWQEKSGPMRNNMKTMAKYKEVDGVWYEWKADNPEDNSLGNLIETGYQSVQGSLSEVDRLIDSLNPFKD